MEWTWRSPYPSITREQKLALWGEGPWLDESDFQAFTHSGLPCLIVRSHELGHLCGYVGVPVGHPWHSKKVPPVDVHGGCNFAAFLTVDGLATDSVEEAHPNGAWWIGFDCCHTFDGVPAWTKQFKELPALTRLSKGQHYRVFAYVEDQTKRLAEQLHVLATDLT